MGIDQERFSDVSQELVCCICTGVLEDPVEIPCRHVFCSECISKWLKNKKNCPKCRKSVRKSAIQPALPMIRNILGSLKMRCLFASQGCTQVVEREKLHIHEAICDYSLAKCSHTGCADTVPRRDLEKHEKDCPNRLVSCANDCGLEVKFVELKNHNCIGEMRAAMAEQARENTLKINNLEERIGKLEQLVQGFSSGPRSKACVSKSARESHGGAANGRTSCLSRGINSRSPQRRQGQRQSSRLLQAHRQDRNRPPPSLPNRRRSRSPPRERSSRFSSSSSSSDSSSSSSTIPSTGTPGQRQSSTLPQAHRRHRNRLQSLPNRILGRSSSSSTSSTSPSTSSSDSSSASGDRVAPRNVVRLIVVVTSSDSSDTE